MKLGKWFEINFLRIGPWNVFSRDYKYVIKELTLMIFVRTFGKLKIFRPTIYLWIKKSNLTPREIKIMDKGTKEFTNRGF